jgi:glucose-6-phosphate isomerase
MQSHPHYILDNLLLEQSQIQSMEEKCLARLEYLAQISRNYDYCSDEASLALASDKKSLWESKKLCKKYSKVSLVIVVGIGGSNLGTKAIYDALFSQYRSVGKTGAHLMFADTPDPSTLEDIIKMAKLKLARSGHVVLNLISKSGTTLESIANFSILYQNLEGFRNLHIVITTDYGSRLEEFAKKKGYDVLNIPNKVGGRFSVFSNVGLFPLCMAGVDCDALLEGAQQAVTEGLEPGSAQSKSAISMYLHSKKGRSSHVSFMFSNRLDSCASWYRQLLGESIAKEHNLDGEKINSGITPITAIGSTDLHSMAQLFLAGPDDKSYRFVTVDVFQKDLEVEKTDITAELCPSAGSKKAGVILNTICSGTKKAFSKTKLPYISIHLSSLDERNIGFLLQSEMIEIMLLGHLFSINPFNQPAVERYKKETKLLMQK